VAIPAREWSYLALYQNCGRDELAYAHNAVPRYFDLKFPRRSILKNWPASQASWFAKRNARDRCREWLTEQIANSPDKPTMTFKQAARLAKLDFDTSRDRFRELWAEVIAVADAAAWSHGGRRRKNPAEKSPRNK
jgi:hypothetical protein